MPLFAIEHALKACNNKKGLELLEDVVDQMLGILSICRYFKIWKPV